MVGKSDTVNVMVSNLLVLRSQWSGYPNCCLATEDSRQKEGSPGLSEAFHLTEFKLCTVLKIAENDDVSN